MVSLREKTVLVTGASRGIGAATAELLASVGANVVVNYREKERRAAGVVAKVEAAGGTGMAIQADITDSDARSKMFAEVSDSFGGLDALVLNASGGMEIGRDAGYAMALNRDAQVDLTLDALGILRPGARLVFLTSHFAHFYGTRETHTGYEAVAQSKKAGEEALRAMRELPAAGVVLVVVSADIVEGTITPRLLERSSPGLLAARRNAVGELPAVDEVAAAVLAALTDESVNHGATRFVGSTD